MSKFLTLSLAFVLWLSIQNLKAQQRPTCGTMPYLDAQAQQDPGLRKRLEKLNAQTEIWVKNNQASLQRKAIVTIPVVVHVVYRTATQNITDAQIQSQIDAMNEDFARLNADAANTPAAFSSLGADTEIRFCLAKRDPNGDPTTGITRTSTTVTSFNDNDAIKSNSRGGKNAWDRNRYLNIWVGNLSSALLGYAQFPGGNAATDGVVISYQYFGRIGTVSAPYNKGRTTTHEVGHWLNLYHIWGDDNGACFGSDFVTDTPNQAGENYGCPTFPKITCNNGPNGDMFMNYMDYTDDACMNMFTIKQKERMQAAIDLNRASLKTSNGCVPVVLQTLDASIMTIVSPAPFSCNSSFTPEVILKNRGTSALTAVTIRYQTDNNPLQTYNWTGNLASLGSATISLTPQTVSPGNHTFTAYTINPNNGTDQDATNDAATVTFTTASQTTGLALPLTESFESGTFPPAGFTINNPDNQLTWDLSQIAAKTGTRSAFINNYDYASNGEKDELVLPALNFTGVSNPGLTFELAYARFSMIDTDTLTVLASSDCGVTYTPVYQKFGNNLATISPVVRTSQFVPLPSEWRKESISLLNYANSSSVLIKFRNSTNYENDLYIDDINVANNIVGITENKLAEAAWQVFPNPANGLIQVKIADSKNQDLKLEIRDVLGKIIMSRTAADLSEEGWQLDVTTLAQGVYIFRLQNGDAVGVRKVLVTR